jgi:DNA invertase Pin-like site-specific DNA recombinase
MKTDRIEIVAYLRTSTDDQILGIDAQRATLQRITKERAGRILKTFEEHESGGDDTRPELRKALHHAMGKKAVLVVAKLDRLARDSKFLMSLYDSGVPIIFGDLPEVDGSAASRLIIQIMASVAEFERKRIGERTKEALAMLKARGVKLGRPENLNQAGRLTGARRAGKAHNAKAIEKTGGWIAERAGELRGQGMSLAAVAKALNAEEVCARQGGTWSATQVKRILDRAAGKVPCRRPTTS